MYRHDSQEFWPERIIEDTKWFYFQGIMLHASYNIECPEEHLKCLLKLFLMFKIRIIYDETIDNKDVPEAVGIICTNCGKSIGCSLDNQNIEDFITIFVSNMVFQNVGLSWIIQSNQKLNFDFQQHCPSWIIDGTWYNTVICSRLHGQVF